MVHRIPIAATTVGILLASLAGVAEAQTFTPVRMLATTSAASGRVYGFVRDANGAAIAEASVLAVGATVVTARSDARGRFHMAVPPGNYVLRAARDGYLSTYREPVRVNGSIPLERTITLVRQDEAIMAGILDDSHAHTELAWRLRHLPRSVLRDGAATIPEASSARPGTEAPSRPGSLLDRTVHTSMRLASRVAGTDFTGQLNFVTTASADSHLLTLGLPPRGVAFLTLGAPWGSAGEWRVRGAVASGTGASWNLLGEYEARETRAHALKFGVSYSAHGARVRAAADRLPRSVREARSVTGVFTENRWQPVSFVEVDYAIRADRYDFLASPYLLSYSAGLRAEMISKTFISVGGGQSMVAPGAEEFLPPPAQGPWLPPERTFSTMGSRDAMRAETVRHTEVGLTREFGRATSPRAMHVRAFTQHAADQIATLFGPAGRPAGHYYIAQAGTVTVMGWAFGVSGTLFGALRGNVEYSRLRSDWGTAARSRGLRRMAPSVVRDAEALDDLTASLEATLNEARTRVRLVYRSNSGFSDDAGGASPLGGSRFDLQVHQALPYRPSRDSRLELLFAVRTLYRDLRPGSSPYDELLTIAPPLRLMGGVQVRF